MQIYNIEKSKLFTLNLKISFYIFLKYKNSVFILLKMMIVQNILGKRNIYNYV